MLDPHEELTSALRDRYELEDVLGEGGMGTIYLARDLKHDRPVAIKTIHPDLTTDDVRKRFQREISITAHLQHPYILPLLDSGVVGEIFYYVMPYVEGESLRARLKRSGKLPAREAVQIACDVAEALEHAHRHDVIHRDIKPSNILLTQDDVAPVGVDHALVVDFGIAKALAEAEIDSDTLTRTGHVVGTPAYMAPEQTVGEATPRSDVYSLGAVLYEALTGRRWPIPTSAEPDWTGVPAALRPILEPALALLPRDRWPDAAAFHEALTSSFSAVGSTRRFFAELKRRRVLRVMAVYGVVAFAIIEAADAIFPRMALPDWTVTLVVWLALLGFPVAIVLAWALELTPEGVQRTAEAAPGELAEIITAPASKQWLAGVLALVGVIALLAGTWYAGRLSAPASGADPAAAPVSESIAVLPFADMSPAGDQEYFSDGISEELLNLLGKIPGLRVAARTSSFSFKGQNLEIPEIAGRLNVAHILEGSVRKEGNQVRITAQLIDARSDTHLWSDSWDRTLDNIFAIQEEIAADVAAQLKVTLLGATPTVEETDPEAYALFLLARQLGRQFTAESIEQSNALYQQALEIDSDYAAAWAGLASNYNFQAAVALLPFAEGFRLAREAANQALAIDSEYALAYATLAAIAVFSDGDLTAAAPYYERALELAPNDPNILLAAALLAQSLGRLDEAIALQEYAVARDPVNPIGHHGLGFFYLKAGRLDEATASLRTALSLSPGFIAAQYGIGEALLWKGEPEAALAAMQQESSALYRLIGLPMAYHALDQAAESDAALAELIDKYEQEAAYNIAYVVAFRGEVDRAFEWLDKAVQYNDPGLQGITHDPLFANIQDDPRWLPFLESIGRSPAQLAAIEFEVRLPQ